MRNKKAFTLIELLIVVAIIAILAAIAVPNFLEAQVRSKVSRTKNDLRTLATALESYFVDTNHYPTDNKPRPIPGDISVNLVPGVELSTPIAYVSSIDSFPDPFRMQRSDLRASVSPTDAGRFRYGYTNFWARIKWGTPPTEAVQATFGMWRLYGAGPDQYLFNNAAGGLKDYSAWSGGAGDKLRNYDPTNGTVSIGDIYRTQKTGAESFNEEY